MGETPQFLKLETRHTNSYNAFLETRERGSIPLTLFLSYLHYTALRYFDHLQKVGR